MNNGIKFLGTPCATLSTIGAFRRTVPMHGILFATLNNKCSLAVLP